MEIKLKLFSSLMEYLPSTAEGNTVKISSASIMSCDDLISKYNIPHEAVQVVMVNGEFRAVELRSEPLADGDVVSIWPSIQGG